LPGGGRSRISSISTPTNIKLQPQQQQQQGTSYFSLSSFTTYTRVLFLKNLLDNWVLGVMGVVPSQTFSAQKGYK
jgi:hypothetical protein